MKTLCAVLPIVISSLSGQKRLEKDEMIARQLSKRGGTLYCKLAGDRVKKLADQQFYIPLQICR
ncbi:hypothetical protein GCM10020331_085380 [Ectobacillus funiculus]